RRSPCAAPQASTVARPRGGGGAAYPPHSRAYWSSVHRSSWCPPCLGPFLSVKAQGAGGNDEITPERGAGRWIAVESEDSRGCEGRRRWERGRAGFSASAEWARVRWHGLFACHAARASHTIPCTPRDRVSPRAAPRAGRNTRERGAVRAGPLP